MVRGFRIAASLTCTMGKSERCCVAYIKINYVSTFNSVATFIALLSKVYNLKLMCYLITGGETGV
jgi:hypothetical protein